MTGFSGLRRRFSDSIGACGVVRAGLNKTGVERTAEVGDAGVIGGHDEIVEFLALGSPFEDVLQERFPKERMEGFSGEAGGGPAGRDDANDSILVVYENPP